MIKNSSGKIFYGMHFYPGVAEYKSEDEQYRLFLNEDTIRKMDASFSGKPVFLDHVDSVEKKVDKLKNQADGWVFESFYNKCDGKHWVKFVAVSEKAINAIKMGFKLSNSYLPLEYGPSGIWNGVEYDKEVLNAEYEHLALVDNPRYDESIILDPEQFKKYNLEKEKQISNSKQENKTMALSFFKKEKVSNEVDYASVLTTLPKSKKELTIEQVINAADEAEMKKKENKADMNGMVKVNEKEEMKVSDLVNKYNEMVKKMNEYEESKKNEDEEVENMDEKSMNEKEKEMNKEDEQKMNEEKEKKMNKIHNADFSKSRSEIVVPHFMTTKDQLDLGKKLY